METYDACAMTASLMKGERVALSEVGLFADGAAVKLVGAETFRISRSLVDEMVLVSTDEICSAIKDTFEDTRAILEPAGALSVAGMKKYVEIKKLTHKTMVCICSGANMNFDRLRFVAERAGLGENKEALISVIIPEVPGAFAKLHSIVYPKNVTELSYRYGDHVNAQIFMSVSLTEGGSSEIEDLFGKLRENNMIPLDASRNEFAKLHARYLTGGRSVVCNERVFRFSFPERPGALSYFLTSLSINGDNQWNSIFR